MAKEFNHSIPVTLSDREENQLLSNSIERVINTSIRLAIESDLEDASMNVQDWKELKSLTVKLWDQARNEVFKRRSK